MLFPAMKPQEGTKGAATSAPAKAGPVAGSQESCEVFYSSPKQKIVPDMISAFAGHSGVKMTKVEDEASLKKDKALEAKHPSLLLPYLQTTSGDVVSTDSGIMGFIGRSSTEGKLYGNTAFEEAKIN